jgi:hypothetical protein
MKFACGKGLLAVCALLLAACGTPESACRDGVAQMQLRTKELVGLGQSEEVRTALERINAAETQLATGNFAGCQESLDEARAFLRKSQRTNQ